MTVIIVKLTLRNVLVSFDPFVRVFHGAPIVGDTLGEVVGSL